MATPAYYRSVDPIDNLVVRVSVRKRTAANSPVAPITARPTAGGAAAPPLPPASGFDDERVEHVGEFAWQQKVFGPRELLRYAHAVDELKSGRRLPHSMSPLEREYVATVEKFIEAGEQLFERPSSIMLFTYTDRDGYVPPSELSRELLAVGQGGVGGPQQPPTLSGDGTPGVGFLARLGTALGLHGLPPPEQSNLAAHLLNPAATDPRGPLARAARERPYSTMYVMAAVGVAKEDFRARRLDTRLWEVPIAVVRYFGSSDPAGGGSGGASVQLIELKPGFSEPLPLDASILHETYRAGVTGDTFLGPGKHGGTLRLRQLTPAASGPPAPPVPPGAGGGSGGGGGGNADPSRRGSGFFDPAAGSGAGGPMAGRWGGVAAAATGLARPGNPTTPPRGGGRGDAASSLWSPSAPLEPPPSTAASAPAAIPAIVEVHSFSTPAPDHATYEFFVLNPAEDVVSSLLTGPLTVHAAGGGGGGAARVAATIGDAPSDPIAQLLAAEHKSVASAAHRAGGLYEWRSSLPLPRPALTRYAATPSQPQYHHPGTFALRLNVELVAAAGFHDCDGVFLAWEVVLPVDQGWALVEGQGLGAVEPIDASARAVVSAEDPWVTLPDAPVNGAAGDSGDSSEDDGEDAGGKVADGGGAVPLLLQQQAQEQGLRQRRQRGADRLAARGRAGWAADASAPAPAPRARALVQPTLSGVTQVAHFAARPWRFGRQDERASGGAVMGRVGTAGSHVYPGMRSSRRTPAAASATLSHQRFSSSAAAATCSTVSGLHDAAGLSAAAEVAAADSESRHSSAFGGGGSDFFRSGRDFDGVCEVPGGSSGEHESLPTRLCCLVERGAPFAPRVPVAHLCCPLPPLHLVFDASIAAAAGRGVVADPPQLYLAAFSRDSWGRTRCEGYGYADFPTAAGTADVVVRTWKAVGDHAAQERDFFLGGGSRLSDATAAGIPASLVAAGRLRTVDAGLAPPGVAASSFAASAQLAADTAPYDPSVAVAASIREASQAVGVNRYGWKTAGSGEIGIRIHALRENAPPVISAASEVEQLAAASARTRTVNAIIADARALRERDRANASSMLQVAGGVSGSGTYY